MSRPTPPAYKTRNWPAYNEALKRRGSLTIWFDPAMTWEAAPTGKRGRQPVYSDAAVQTCLTMKVLFGMALRQTTGFVESLLCLIGLDWTVPNFSTLSRRQKTLKVNIPYRGSQGPLHLLIDSTGVKVEGEGAWSEEDQKTVRGTVFPTNAQARWHETPCMAQDPHRDRRENLRNSGGGAHHQRCRRRAHAARTARTNRRRSGDRKRHRRWCLRHPQVP